MNLLFTNAGRRTYLVEFALELKAGGYPLEIFVSDCTETVPTFHVSNDVNTIIMPPSLEDREAYKEALLKAVAGHDINVIIPLSDLDQDIIAGANEMLRDKGAVAVVPGGGVIDCCMNKRRADEFCRDNDIPTPKSWFSAKGFAGPFPCIQKHIEGSGSSGFDMIWNPGELNRFEEGRDMLQALVRGTEYGIDILNDLEGNFVSACVKRKMLMRAGETDRAKVVRHGKIEALAKRIGETFGHVGNLDVDVMESENGDLFCMDFNPRFGGGYPATHISGMNYLKAVLDMAAGNPVTLPAEPRPVTVMKGLSIYWFEDGE